MSFIENIKEKNQFPIIFIGSGITQRYFENAPRWEELLLTLWGKVHEREGYFEEFHKLQSSGLSNFEIYLRIAQILEKDIDNAFYERKLKIENIEIEQAHSGLLSPFKQCVANIFSGLIKKKGMDDEIKSFAQMLVKARFIVTTNYDNFIEECFNLLNKSVKVNVGNKGLFIKTNDYGELYKIHGSIKDINSICITEKDYKQNESKLAIVNAKILSNLTEAPILFLGYSLTDENIRSLLSDYSENIPYDLQEAAARIGVVEYKKGEQSIQDVVSSIPDLGMHYTKISTDNYKEIYDTVSKIEQGYLPSEIAKYEGLFRKIIEVKGQENQLQSVLASFVDISQTTSEDLKNKNIVVAFGDDKYIYKIPSYVDYIKEYFNSKNEMPLEVALTFLTNQSMRTDIPFNKYLSRINELIENAKRDKYIQKLTKWEKKYKESGLDNFIEISKTKVSKKYLQSLKSAHSPQEIYDLTGIKEYSKIYYIISNIRDFDETEIRTFINNLLEKKSDNSLNKTEYRKLFMAYCLLIER
ncbi:SIR2 family protein [Lactococcus lactis]|uniref:SIR2 family protein n=1 Tax=Lactococcus lactis TaxID=1358 RepID=UPI001F56D61F|nr:SIR2 family protein [Lactococcus lactis]